jgi:hypothetical protein
MSDRDEVVITIKIRERSKDGDGDNGGKGGGGGNGGPGPTATPYLLIPSGVGDVGQRSLTLNQALASGGLQAMVTNPNATQAWTDFEIQLSCVLANLGAVASAAGLVEFYVGDQFGVWNPAHQGLTPAQIKANAQLVGRATFTAPPGKTTTLLCPNLWKPGSPTAAQKGVLAQVFDLFADPTTAPFDAVDDRHVARNDGIIGPIIDSVTVSGGLSPRMKFDVIPRKVSFIDAATGQKFSAAVTEGQYTILLPNTASYHVSVTWEFEDVMNTVGGTSDVGTLNLNVSATTYTFDIAW